MTDRPSFLRRTITWLRAGYPSGIPQQDYVALLGVLHRRLTDAEVTMIAAELAQHAQADTPIAEAEIRSLIETRAFEGAYDEDVARVSARLASGGWPLAGPPPENDAEADDDDEPIAEGSVLARILAWLREGYPQGVPDYDYQPLLALLQRRLTKSEVKKVAKALRRAEVIPAGPGDIADAITDLTNAEPSANDVRRVRNKLAAKGWPVEFPDPGEDEPAR
jgi:hypothetical protein